ncbi:energy transducer TonB family protein [Undibacterium sp. Ren11W]|uniref:energy transducer TonB family protein n=1 Tax=Undibacterium sp. Ren11W TaxID=3413045 RepID=UPI003BF01248
MKIRRLLLLACCAVAACSTPIPGGKKSDEVGKQTNEIGKKTNEKVGSSNSFTLNGYKRELAQRISERNSGKVYTDRPQALLRSVVVLKYTMNADGKLLRSDVLRSNHDKVTENIALASISNAAPFPKPSSLLVKNGKLEITETWLFNDDARFQLRTIAQPQMTE